MFLDKPGQTIRLFYADKNHDLWKNHPNSFLEKLSVGFHAHHCDLTIQSLTTYIGNWNVSLNEHFDYNQYSVDEYEYESPIKGQGRFVFKNQKSVLTDDFKRLMKGDALKLKANQLHTVYVPRDKTAAWLVYEGAEDPNYKSYCYSNENLEKFDFSEHYKPLTETEILEILDKVDFRMNDDDYL